MSIFYLIFIGLCLYFCYRYDSIKEYDSHKQHRLWLMCIYMILLTGFSYGLGGDKFVYMREFEEYPDTFTEANDYIFLQFMLKGQMPLWTLLNLFAKSVFHSFYAVQLIQSIAINTAVCYIASKYTHRYFLFLLIYFFSLQYFILNTEVMREGLALAFALIGMHCYLIGRKVLFILLLLTGLLFHISAIIGIVFLFTNLKVSWKPLAIAFFSAFAIWLLSDVLLGKVIVAALGGMGAIVGKILFYSIQASTIFGFLRSAITFIIFPFIIMYIAMHNEPDEQRRKKMERIIVYMLYLGILASSFAGLARFYNYVRIFYLVLFAEFAYTLFCDKKLFIIRLGTLIGTIFLIMLQYMIPYKTTGTHYYDFFYPYTCILDENRSVYFREVAHTEAVEGEISDNNVRNIE